MIVTSIGESFPLYRAHTPKWASEPLSGAGAARHGGRFNRPGVHALYLSTTQMTAIDEYQQGEPLMPPFLMAAYRVRLASVVDFRGGYVPGKWDPLWQDAGCNWRELAMLEEVEPPSWTLSDTAIAGGHAGILFPSQRTIGGMNLVIFTDFLQSTDALEVIDPSNLLPRDQSSWGKSN